MPVLSGTRIGAYEVVAKVGEGGMGAVYRARDLHLNRDVALKVLPDDVADDESRRARLHREARALAALNDPHIAAIYGWEQSGDRPVLVMEFVDGRPLSEMIGRGGLPLDRALRYAVQIASGLAVAHRAGIVHRDLKPSNIMVSSSGEIKLLDFGLARSATEQAVTEGEVTRSDGSHTGVGAVVGTAAYMSPEQAQGLPVDQRSDIFSFGVVLYEMCTGHRPFRGDTPAATLAAILKDEPEPASRARGERLPPDLERLILMKCLRKDPDRRVQTAADLRVSLEDVREELSSGAIVAAPARLRDGRARRWVLMAASAVLAIGIAGWAIWSRSAAPLPAGRLRQLTDEAGVALTPALSPDGRLLAYASDRAGEGVLDLWVKQVAGGDPVRVSAGIGGVSEPQFSPDGTQLYALGYQNDIFEVSTFGGAPRKVIERAGPFSVAPSGEIAFARVATGGAASTIQIVSNPGGIPVPWRPECQSITAPAWSPDGSRLAFVGECHDAVGLFVAPRTGGTPTMIRIREPNAVPEPALSPVALTPSRLRGFIGWSSLGWFRADDGREGVVAAWRDGDTINIDRFYFDGTREPLTLGTGWETGPGVAANGAVAFMRAEMTPTVWSLPLDHPGNGATPRREVAPASLFAVSKDGRLMTFGKILGPDQGEIRARRLDTGLETVLASHQVANWGVGSFWGTVSADGQRVFYRVNRTANNVFYVAPTAGGSARELSIFDRFNLGSDWDEGDSRVLGECQPTTKGVCAVDPVSGRVTGILTDPEGAELLYPSMSWDGRWMTFMRRLSGRTSVYVVPEQADGIARRLRDWIPISPPELTGSRPRFAPDGNSLFYLLTDRGTVSLVRQTLDPATKHPVGEPTRITTVQVFPTTLSYSFGASASIIEVTRDRIYYNTIDLRSNVWLTAVK